MKEGRKEGREGVLIEKQRSKEIQTKTKRGREERLWDEGEEETNTREAGRVQVILRESWAGLNQLRLVMPKHHQPIQLNWLWVPNICSDFGVRAGPAAERPD